MANRLVKPVKIGPWPLGVNNREGDFAFRGIKPTELLACSNFDIHENGFLENRRGVVSYAADLFKAKIGGVIGALSLRNVIGSVRLDNDYKEGLVQFYDSTNLQLYVLKTSVIAGELSDFAAGYWVKQAITAGQNYWLTSVLRYNKNIYLTTNNAYLNEASTFGGGFYYGYSPIPTVKTVFKVAPNYPSGPLAGTVAPVMDMCIDNADNIYLLVSASGGATLDGFIQKITSAGVSTVFCSGLDLVREMCTDGTNLYITGFGSGVSLYGNPVSKVDSTGNLTNFPVPTLGLYYSGLIYDPSINSIVASQNFQIDSTGYANLVSINVSTQVSTNIWLDNTGGELANGAGALALSTTQPGVYYGLEGDLNGELNTGSPRIDSYSSAGIGIPAVEFSVLGDVVVDLIQDRFNPGNDGLYVADGVATNGQILKVNVGTQVVTTYVTGLDGPTAICEDSAGNLFIYEHNQNRIIEAQVPSIPTLNPIAGMPFGDISFMFKDRMFIINKATDEIFYSKATDPTAWNTAGNDGSGFFFVNPGDGLPITDVVVANNQMFIFKESGTWIFTFTADPAADGVLRVLSADRGAFSATVYNNTVYLVGAQGVQYIGTGNVFKDLSQQIKDFHKYLTNSSIIDVLDNKLIVTVNAIPGVPTAIVMNLLNGAWSTYMFNTGNSYSLGSSLSPSVLQDLPTSVNSHMFDVGADCKLFMSVSAIGGIHPFKSDNLITTALGTIRTMPVLNMATGYLDFATPLEWKKLTRAYIDLLNTFAMFEDVDNPLTVAFVFKSPSQMDVGTVVMNDRAIKPNLGPDSFPVAQVIYDVSTNQYFSAHRFQAMGISFSSNPVGLLLPNNNSVIVVKSIAGYITERIGASGEGVFIGV